MALREMDPISAEEPDNLGKGLDELMAVAQGESILAQEPTVVPDPTPDPTAGPKKRKAEKRRTARRRTAKVSLRLAVLLVSLAIAGTAYALTQTTLTAEQIEIFKTQTLGTDFTVSSYTSTPSGARKVDIVLNLDNDDAGGAHQANVTVNLLNATGGEIANITKATGVVAASGQVTLTFKFNQVNLVAEYESAQIVVKQSS